LNDDGAFTAALQLVTPDMISAASGAFSAGPPVRRFSVLPYLTPQLIDAAKKAIELRDSKRRE
jgi:hypothetical protein